MLRNSNGVGKGSHVIDKKDGSKCCEKAYLDNSLDSIAKQIDYMVTYTHKEDSYHMHEHHQ